MKKFELPEIEVVRFSVEDVIATSTGDDEFVPVENETEIL